MSESVELILLVIAFVAVVATSFRLSWARHKKKAERMQRTAERSKAQNTSAEDIHK